MLNVLLNIFPIFAAILVTLWFRLKKQLPENFSTVTSFIAFQIVIPVLLFQVLSRAEFNQESMSLVYFSAILVIILIANGLLLSKLLGKSKGQKGVLHFSQLDFYVYGFGMPFILANFDSTLVSRIVVMDTLVFLCYLVFGSIIASFYSSKSVQLKDTLLDNTVRSLFFWTISISLLVNFLNLPVPDKVYELGNFFSSSFGLLAALLIGSSITLPKIDAIKAQLLAYFSRVLVVAFTITIATSFLSFGRPDVQAMWLTFMVPFGSFGIVLAAKHNNDKDFMAQLHIASFTLALILYPLLIGWLKTY